MENALETLRKGGEPMRRGRVLFPFNTLLKKKPRRVDDCTLYLKSVRNDMAFIFSSFVTVVVV
jgi:hypothetical protein